eukprot:11219034-Lingulodinium_polyedra.AAC.1
MPTRPTFTSPGPAASRTGARHGGAGWTNSPFAGVREGARGIARSGWFSELEGSVCAACVQGVHSVGNKRATARC